MTQRRMYGYCPDNMRFADRRLWRNWVALDTPEEEDVFREMGLAFVTGRKGVVETMKAISIKQPWAWLIISGYKTVENRKWYTAHRGDILIHASKSKLDLNEI